MKIPKKSGSTSVSNVSRRGGNSQNALHNIRQQNCFKASSPDSFEIEVKMVLVESAVASTRLSHLSWCFEKGGNGLVGVQQPQTWCRRLESQSDGTDKHRA